MREQLAEAERIARHLVGAPRLVQAFEWQDLPTELHKFTDSDWAGDSDTRKSTSGGAITWGWQTLKAWLPTQQVVALSSGEADLYVLVKDVAPSHSLASMLNDFGTGVGCIVCTDDSAAIGMVYRQGFCKT